MAKCDEPGCPACDPTPDEVERQKAWFEAVWESDPYGAVERVVRVASIGSPSVNRDPGPAEPLEAVVSGPGGRWSGAEAMVVWG